MFRAPQWHSATQTHFPPRPRKSQWHCDTTNVVSPHRPPHTRRHSDITDVILPHRLPLLSPAPKSSFPRYICTTNWPLLSPSLKGSFPYYTCTTSWPLPQRVAPELDKSHSRLHFAPSTRTISAEGCAHTGQIALSPASRALDTHDLRKGLRAHRTNRTLACISRTRHARSPQRALHFRLTLFVPPSAFKENLQSGGMFFIKLGFSRESFSYLHLHAYTWILTLGCLHLDAFTCKLSLLYFSAIVSIEV